jgi:hypothetical protein
MRAVIHPARYRISGKSQDERSYGMVYVGVAGNGRDKRWLRIHGSPFPFVRSSSGLLSCGFEYQLRNDLRMGDHRQMAGLQEKNT